MHFYFVAFIILTVQNLCAASESIDDQCIYIQLGTGFYQKPPDCNRTRDICGGTIDIVALNTPPYSDETLLPKVIENCCRGCPHDPTKRNGTYNRMKVNDRTIKNYMGMVLEIGHFVYPFLGPMNADILYARYFIPIFPVPTLFYVTRNDGNVLGKLIWSALDLYPLVIICITLAIISGFIIWSLETWFNETEFPRPFFIGWFEGFWWVLFLSFLTSKVPICKYFILCNDIIIPYVRQAYSYKASFS